MLINYQKADFIPGRFEIFFLKDSETLYLWAFFAFFSGGT